MHKFLLPLGLSLLPTVVLHADSFTYTISTGPTNGSAGITFSSTGTITGTADPFVAGAFDITGITGSAPTHQFPEYSFNGLYTANTNSHQTASAYGYTFNNVFYTAAAPYADNNGFLLYLTSDLGTSLAHVFFDPTLGSYFVQVTDPNDPADTTAFQITSFSFSPTSPVPEPSTLAFVGTGLVALGGSIRRRITRS